MTKSSNPRYSSSKIDRWIAFCLVALITSVWINGFTSRAATLALEEFAGPGYEPNGYLAGLGGGTNWSGPWNGPANGVTLRPGKSGLGEFPGVSLRAMAQDCMAFRTLNQTLGTEESTIWIGCVIKKEAGSNWFGLSCFQGGSEKLFVGAANGNDNIRLGHDGWTSINARAGHQAVIRIDFHRGKDKAYLFLDPGATSIPDIEGANAMVTGDFSFDRIRIGAGRAANGGTNSGWLGSIRIGSEFFDVITTAAKSDSMGTATNPPLSVTAWEKRNDALWLTTSGGALRLRPLLDRTLQVQFGKPQEIESLRSYAVRDQTPALASSVTETDGAVILNTANFSVRVMKSTSQVSIFDANGKLLVEEALPVSRDVGAAGTVADRFRLTATEPIYGLGEYRDGYLNLRGKRRELVQVNTQAALPVLVSVNGWGMFWDNPSRTVFADGVNGMSFNSDFGKAMSFYVFVGPQLDSLVQEYRRLTGAAPLPPEWALGYHQSRNKYGSQPEVLSIASRLRAEHIPADSIFIDYFYWGKYGVGSHHFDEDLFPNARKMIGRLHKEFHLKTIVTVWPTFKAGTDNYDAMKKAGLLLNGAVALGGTIYDPFNPKAADLYWKQVNETLVPLGIDGWFLDGPEPDGVNSFLNTTTFDGPAAHVRNVYPLVHSTTFYNGLRAARPNVRPYIITRCAWSSQQKNGTVVWSGDVASTFEELTRQVTAGLGFEAAGIPYWTTDIGGYSGGNANSPAYRELYTRWWEYGTFCPIFRSHGRREAGAGNIPGPNELWAFGTNVQSICTEFGNLRYRLLPYIYSMSDAITQTGYTPMRPLAFDFPSDTNVYDIKDEFMYGPAFLVNPVTHAGMTRREVYLPAGARWVNFWTGEVLEGGQTITAEAPIDRIPIFVHAGAVVPMGPGGESTDETAPGPIELRVYRGASGGFDLYADDGKTFNYEKGECARIPISWDQTAQTLTVGPTAGHYPQMPKSTLFNVVWVSGQNAIGAGKAQANETIKYTGAKVVVSPLSATARVNLSGPPF